MDKKNAIEADKLRELRKWFIENPKLPEDIHDLMLKRFLKCVSHDMEEAKRIIEYNFTSRNQYPQIFLDRDPLDESLQEFYKHYDILQLPGLTPDRYRIIFFRPNFTHPNQVNSTLESKLYHMLSDIRFTMVDGERKPNDDSTNDPENEDDDDEITMADGDVQVLDVANYKISHMMRVSLLTLRFQTNFLQEAHPVRMRALHIINCPSYMDKMVSIVRQFIRDDVFNMIHFHRDGFESLYEFVPKDMLPNEYGGKAGTIPDLKTNWMEILKQKRDYLMDEKYWKVEQPKSRWSFW